MRQKQKTLMPSKNLKFFPKKENSHEKQPKPIQQMQTANTNSKCHQQIPKIVRVKYSRPQTEIVNPKLGAKVKQNTTKQNRSINRVY